MKQILIASIIIICAGWIFTTMYQSQVIKELNIKINNSKTWEAKAYDSYSSMSSEKHCGYIELTYGDYHKKGFFYYIMFPNNKEGRDQLAGAIATYNGINITKLQEDIEKLNSSKENLKQEKEEKEAQLKILLKNNLYKGKK